MTAADSQSRTRPRPVVQVVHTRRIRVQARTDTGRLRRSRAISLAGGVALTTIAVALVLAVVCGVVG